MSKQVDSGEGGKGANDGGEATETKVGRRGDAGINLQQCFPPPADLRNFAGTLGGIT